MASIQAIPTRYRGYNFRSRMEARWAVAFQEMGLTWEYEPQGFFLPSGKTYLPDFKVELPCDGLLWIEIKPFGVSETQEFAEFMRMVSDQSRGCILHGIPDPVSVRGGDSYYSNDGPHCIRANNRSEEPADLGENNFYTFCACTKCRTVGFQRLGVSTLIRCSCKGKEDIFNWPGMKYNWSDIKVLKAFAAARAARFEHEHREVW